MGRGGKYYIGISLLKLFRPAFFRHRHHHRLILFSQRRKEGVASADFKRWRKKSPFSKVKKIEREKSEMSNKIYIYQ